MKKVEVLGSGCPTCKSVLDLVQKVVDENNNIEAEVNYITDMAEIMKRGVVGSPAVMVDGAIKVIGRVPSEEEIKNWLEE